ncbi:MAG TPA: hypothetical protein VEB63_05815 [Chitinophagaceae bacterium]|nr:hypothetical protein [Chitinophagaceae bacterium]
MEFNFVKNIQFTRLVKAEGRLREFNFRKFRGENSETLFSVDVVDDRGNRIIFRMRHEADGWKILPAQLPSWIINSESNLNSLIEEELRQAS